MDIKHQVICLHHSIPLGNTFLDTLVSLELIFRSRGAGIKKIIAQMDVKMGFPIVRMG